MKMPNYQFDFLKINIASPDRIQKWGEKVLPNGDVVGEITKSETLNYKTLKPEIEGLFCERIFGPNVSWQCYCEEYKKVQYDTLTICEFCGVEVTESRVRRHRMGYIKLLCPATHIWYLKSLPNYLAYILNTTAKELKEIVYFHMKKEKFSTFDFLYPEEALDELFPEKDEIKPVGAEIIYDLLREVNLDLELEETREIYNSLEEENERKGDDKRKRAAKRIRILESFILTKSKPEWMVFKLLPVLPPGLRPMVTLENGKMASSDLNELYRRILNRNNRLERLSLAYSPASVLRTEKRLIQEAVDALIDNGKRPKTSIDLNARQYKSLAEIIEGKEGRFRLNLLGKRVDYSGRSVIIVGPSLELNQCGLPYNMAIELFKPFLIHELIQQKLTGSLKVAKKIIKKKDLFMWNLVQKITKTHPILLNRAPTLHRLGVQAFEPIITRELAIQLHPLVCSAFNADFDGDQMGVHIPLSLEAQIEAKLLLFAPHHFLSAAIDGQPILQPTQDMVLGFYYLTTLNKSNLPGSNHYFSNFDDVIFAYEQKQVSLHSSIWVRSSKEYKLVDQLKLLKLIKLKDKTVIKFYNNLQVRHFPNKKIIVQYIRTTPGRIILNKALNYIGEIYP
jgi:DNA-directed RNA polymerase subunit beta'